MIMPTHQLTTPVSLDLQWYALYAKSRHEKFIDRELNNRHIECFLPLRRLKHRWSDRTVVVEEPLFTGYIFVRVDPFRRREILTVKGALRFVSAGSRPIVIGEKKISDLRTLIEHAAELEPYPYLQEGDRVVVKSGPFKGVEGLIVRKNNKSCQLVISVEGIMRSASMILDAGLVDKI